MRMIASLAILSTLEIALNSSVPGGIDVVETIARSQKGYDDEEPSPQ